MKQVLVYLYKSQLGPTGGPLGYNYNLCQQIEKNGITNISFLETSVGDTKNINSWVDRIKIKSIREFVKICKSIVAKYKLLYGKSHKAVVDLNRYDIIHFHGIMAMWRCQDDLRNYKGKVVLTSHTPNRPSTEIMTFLSSFEQNHMMWFYKKFYELDKYAFERADYIIFPCEEAEEPYHHLWPYFSEIKKANPQKFRYMLTGINGCRAKIDKADVRRKYSIPQSAFVICYVGRHNEIKGYDTFKNICAKLLEFPDVYVLVAGQEAPLKGIPHDRWIEVGWTNDPHSIIAASDVFVLANKETYFDLVMLEVLSLGSIVVASRTGGNKYFDRLKPNAVYLFDNTDEAISTICKLKAESSDVLDYKRRSNREMFEKYFTAETFLNNYLQVLDSLN